MTKDAVKRQASALMPQHRLDRPRQDRAKDARVGAGFGLDRDLTPGLHQDPAGAGQQQQISVAALGLEQRSDMIGRVEPCRGRAEPNDDVSRRSGRPVPRQQSGQVEIGGKLQR